jgi:DNA adenine methylase
MRNASPLRYPGGKWRISKYFERVITLNRLSKCPYVEPYAGGASLALSLLLNNQVSEIHLNDLDFAIHSFWSSILRRTKDFLDLLDSTEVTTDEWYRQKEVYRNPKSDDLSLGFATFFLNRTNYSGILNGGMIGGEKQSGVWKLDARFNRIELRCRIERIAKMRSRIHVSHSDAMIFLRDGSFDSDCLIYLDPPYYTKGNRLYHNSYRYEDHLKVSQTIMKLKSPWVVSYDDVPEIRDLYRGTRSRRLSLLHTARSARAGFEVLFFGPGLRIPRT